MPSRPHLLQTLSSFVQLLRHFSLNYVSAANFKLLYFVYRIRTATAKRLGVFRNCRLNINIIIFVYLTKQNFAQTNVQKLNVGLLCVIMSSINPKDLCIPIWTRALTKNANTVQLFIRKQCFFTSYCCSFGGIIPSGANIFLARYARHIPLTFESQSALLHSALTGRPRF